MDWWAPLGVAGETEIVNRVADQARERILESGDGGPLEMTTFAFADRAVRVVVDEARLAAYDGDEEVAVVTLPPGGTVLDRPLSFDLREVRGRAARLVGPRREWAISDGEHRWSWRPARRPGTHPSLRRSGDDVVTVRRGTVSDDERAALVHARHAVSWTPGACRAEVLLGALITLADLGEALHGRWLRAAGTAVSIAMVVADLMDEDGQVTPRTTRRVSRLPAPGPPRDPPGPSSAR